MNPLVPEFSDVLWASALILNAILVVAALVALPRVGDKRRWLSVVLLILIVPIVGPIASLVATRRGRVAQKHLSVNDGASAS